MHASGRPGLVTAGTQASSRKSGLSSANAQVLCESMTNISAKGSANPSKTAFKGAADPSKMASKGAADPSKKGPLRFQQVP